MNRRRVGQIAAASLAVICFGWALWASNASAIPELRIYDGYWMMLGATVAALVVAPLVWRWPREWSLIAITLGVLIGSIVPLVLSARRIGMPILVRLRGSWVLGGADVVVPALVIGFVSLWFALREYRAAKPGVDRG